MSIVNGVWHDTRLDPPGAGDINRPLLVVRETSSHRFIDFAIYSASTFKVPDMIWDGKWNKRGVIYWMPLPKMPEGET